MRYFLHLAYDGSNYHGWQRQLNANTVQEELEGALAKLFRTKVGVLGCGRTDTGVHASDFYAHFNFEGEIEDFDKTIFKLNYILPHDIAIYNLFEVGEKAHARFDATDRSYEYWMHFVKDPFLKGKSVFIPYKLDRKILDRACEILLRHEDFAAFCKAGSDVKTTLCNLTEARWEERGNRLVFCITANRFLRNMVRAIVGTMIDLGRGKITLEEFEKIINSGERSSAGASASPQGLYLTKVAYPFL